MQCLPHPANTFFPGHGVCSNTPTRSPGTGFNKAISVLFTSEEALLNRAEAYIMKMNEDPAALDKALEDMNLYAANLFSAGFKSMTEASIIKWATETYPDYSELYVGKTSPNSQQTLNPKKKLHAAPYNTLEEGSPQESMLQALIFMRRYQFLHEGMRWFDTRSLRHHGLPLPAG